MNKKSIINLVLASMFIALGVLMPIIFHAVGMTAGAVFLPMHIPVLLCGMLCGHKYGGVCGAMVPFLSGVITGMPPIYPVAVYMAFELAAYAVIAGILIKKFDVYIALVGAMLGGRLVLGIVQAVMLGFGGNGFTLGAFLTSAFVTSLPGIAIQMVVVQAVVLLLKRAGLMTTESAQ